jgi:hypothetical protein
MTTLRSGGDGPNPLDLRGKKTTPPWDVTVRCGGEGPIPLEVTIKWGGSGPPIVERSANQGTIPPADLPAVGGKPKRKLQSGDLGHGAVCFNVPGGYRLFFRVRAYMSLGFHRCLLSSTADCASLGTINPNVGDLDWNTTTGQWAWSTQFEGDSICLAAGLTSPDGGSTYALDEKMYCEVWELDNGQYYYFGFYDKDVVQPPLPGNFVVEALAAGFSPATTVNLTGNRPPVKLS